MFYKTARSVHFTFQWLFHLFSFFFLPFLAPSLSITGGRSSNNLFSRLPAQYCPLPLYSLHRSLNICCLINMLPHNIPPKILFITCTHVYPAPAHLHNLLSFILPYTRQYQHTCTFWVISLCHVTVPCHWVMSLCHFTASSTFVLSHRLSQSSWAMHTSLSCLKTTSIL